MALFNELSHLILTTKTATKYGANYSTILVALLTDISGFAPWSRASLPSNSINFT